MKRLGMVNGQVTAAEKAYIRLRCRYCERLQDYREGEQSGVYCGGCGKRHSRKSLVDASVVGADE